VTSIAPGELLSIFSERLPFWAAFLMDISTSLGGISVTFNGIAGPLLYVSTQQINVQAPYEIAGGAQTTLTLNTQQTNTSDSRTLPVIARNPVAFLTTPAYADLEKCDLVLLGFPPGPFPLAFNSDGSLTRA